MVLDPIHYLATLGRKPALDHSPVYRTGSFPRASPTSVPNCEHCMAPWPATGSSCGSYSSWASIPWNACDRLSRPAGSNS